MHPAALFRYSVIALLLVFSSFAVAANKYPRTNPWIFSIGVLGGPYATDFQYRALYFSSRGAAAAASLDLRVNDDTWQMGYSFGAQLLLRYYFTNSPVFLGESIGFVSNSSKAVLTKLVDDSVAPNTRTFQMNNELRLRDSLNTAIILGIDMTPRTHAYLKGGASMARLSHYFFTTQSQIFLFPLPFYQTTQNKNIWGWLVGLGAMQDLNRWLSSFIEFDYFNYGRRVLQARNDIVPFILVAGQTDVLNQRVNIDATAIYLGLNINFGGTFSPDNYLSTFHPWMAYVGGFLGSYNANFKYGGNYFANTGGGANLIFNNDTSLQGILAGGQIGLQYHATNPYYFGLVYSAMINANKTRLTEHLPNAVAAADVAFDITHEFRLNNNQDLAAMLGLDIASSTHVYTKGGISVARLSHQLITSMTNGFPNPEPFLKEAQQKNIWGWVLGVGLVRDLSKWINAFVEYDYYDYGSRELKTFEDITPFDTAAAVDHLTQHIKIHSSAVHAGLNLTLGGYAAPSYSAATNGWAMYLGILGAYLGENFHLGSNYSNSAGAGEEPEDNILFNTSAKQIGLSGGVQWGVEYHMRSPYFFGAVLDSLFNSQRARTALAIENIQGPTGAPINLVHEFQAIYNADLAGLIGIDITARAHGYFKVGGSYALIRDHFETESRMSTPEAIMPRIPPLGILGWISGCGLSYDLSRGINIFAEYDYYDYGHHWELQTLDNGVAPELDPTAGERDHLTHHVTIFGSSVRVGLNMKFAI